MKFVSIDIETTGLDEHVCQILEVGAVIADFENVYDSNRWKFYTPLIIGEPYAINLNQRLIAAMLTCTDYIDINKFPRILSNWVGSVNVFAGKNLGTFDLRFLRKIKGWDQVKFHQRVLDPTMYYLHHDDIEPPNLKTCMQRAGLPMLEHHDAVSDALMVVQLLQKAYRDGKIG